MLHSSRRDFLRSAAATVTLVPLRHVLAEQTEQAAAGNSSPVVISSANGLRATARAAELIRGGVDPLDAAIAGVNIIEEDPEDATVGYGGLPNEDGVVELDSCVMHGPTCGAGGVAALRSIKTPSKVARLVMQRTDHVLLVGEGALRFARAHGFQEVDLLTEKARILWLRWKERRSDDDDWIAPPDTSKDNAQGSATSNLPLSYGTITCCALNAAGDLGGVTTTSGLSFKIPGRVGDSPIIGAGLYVNNSVGAAGSTGRGEAVIKICGSHTVVESMRHGKAPVDACLDGLRRIVETTTEPRLKRTDGRPNFDVKFYALAKNGGFGAASIWSGAQFAVHADGTNRLEDCAFLYERRENDS